MKWIYKILIVVTVFSAISYVRAEESGPWGFQNIAIINLPLKNVHIVRSLDRKGVELQFPKWSLEIEESIKNALSKSPLKHRLFPLRQITMAVEIYSITSDVDFAARPTKNQTQVIIGEVRHEKATSDLLNIDKVAMPVPEVARLVRLGKYTSARNELYKARDKGSHSTQILYRARISLIDYLKRGRSAIKCPNIRSVKLDDIDAYEALILNAWCNKERGDSDLALDYLKLLRKVKPNEMMIDRVNELEQVIISSRVLSMDRRGHHIHAAANALKHLKVIKTSLREISFIETVASNLIRTNLANPLAQMIQEMIAGDKRKRVRELEPILVESYLASGKHVLAMDAANYFLFRPQPTWNKGRLLRGFGLSQLQSGDWKQAHKSLTEAKNLGVEWGPHEELSLIEAAMRGHQVPPEELNQLLNNFAENNRRIDGFYKKWFFRLADEVDLRRGHRIDKEKLAKLPGFILYDAAKKAQGENQRKRELELMGSIKEKSGGWEKLSKTMHEIDEMRQKLDEIEKTLEKIR